MRHTTKILIAVVVLGIGFVDSAAAGVIIGDAANGGNFFPFGGAGSGDNSRYQQVYSSSQFPGTIVIDGVKFFQNNVPGGNFSNSTFNFSFSITSKLVDGLDTSNLDNNVTGAVLGTGSFVGGGLPATGFSVDLTDFSYDPSLGNLLMDITIPGGAVGGASLAFFDSYNSGSAGGIFSRAHNFGTGFEGFGLKTEFLTVSGVVPEPASLAIFGFVGIAGCCVRRKRKQCA